MVNKVILIGRITKDFETFTTKSGIANVQVSLAVGRDFKQEGQPEADFINVVAWRKTAELLAEYCSKGSLIAVVGRLQTRHYTHEKGYEVWVTEVVADSVQFLDTKKHEWDEAREKTKGATWSKPQNNGVNQTAYGDTLDITDGELPF